MLYDTDILEENVLLEWGSKKASKKVSKELSQEIHNRAEPFLTWLKEAEEEEESSEDEEDDLEVNFYTIDYIHLLYCKIILLFKGN
jgi:translation initiation factor 5